MKSDNKILKERARQLAIKNEMNLEDQTNNLHVVEFFLAPEHYGIES